MLSYASDKAELFAENLSKNSNLDDSNISLHAFPSKNYRPVSLLSVVSKVFEKLVNNIIVDHLDKSCHCFDFQYGFRSSRSTADLLIVISDRIARAFNRSGATRAVALDISKAFDRIWHVDLLHKLKSYGISGQTFGLTLLFSVIDSFEWFWLESLYKKIQLMLEFLKAPFLVPHFSYYTSMAFLTMLSVILLSMLMMLLLILSMIRNLTCGNNLNWLLNLNLIDETLRTGVRSGLLISMHGKLRWFRFAGQTIMVLLL